MLSMFAAVAFRFLRSFTKLWVALACQMRDSSAYSSAFSALWI